MNTRILRRLPFVLALGVAPAVALAWGCGDDETVPAGPRVNVDPGGTWGAEVTVTVTGRGRVVSGVLGVDCPSGSCFAKYVFPSNTADGAAGGIALTATPTEGATFLGWTFEAASVGARGRGPEGCNPIARPSTQPSGITTEPTIALPFGEVDGTAPAGKDCAGFTKVPLAYVVTAKFDAELPPIDAGYDGGADEILYESPDPGSSAAEGLGLTQGGGLYWKYSSAGVDAIGYGSSPSSSILGQSAIRVAAAPDIQNFRVMRFGVVYTDGQNVFVFRSSSPTNAISVGTMTTIGTCRGFAMDSSSNVYCRTATSLVRWQTQGSTAYAAPVVLYGTGIPTGNDVAVDTSFGPAYLDTGTAIASLSLQPGDFDGGLANPTSVITGRGSLQNFRSGTGGFAWSENGSGIYTTQSKTAGTTVAESTASTGTLSTLAQDQGSSSSWVAAGTSGIFLAPLGSPAIPFRGGNQFTSAAASSQYVFWTNNTDARVHRARR